MAHWWLLGKVEAKRIATLLTSADTAAQVLSERAAESVYNHKTVYYVSIVGAQPTICFSPTQQFAFESALEKCPAGTFNADDGRPLEQSAVLDELAAAAWPLYDALRKSANSKALGVSLMDSYDTIEFARWCMRHKPLSAVAGSHSDSTRSEVSRLVTEPAAQRRQPIRPPPAPLPAPPPAAESGCVAATLRDEEDVCALPNDFDLTTSGWERRFEQPDGGVRLVQYNPLSGTLSRALLFEHSPASDPVWRAYLTLGSCTAAARPVKQLDDAASLAVQLGAQSLHCMCPGVCSSSDVDFSEPWPLLCSTATDQRRARARAIGADGVAAVMPASAPPLPPTTQAQRRTETDEQSIKTLNNICIDYSCQCHQRSVQLLVCSSVYTAPAGEHAR